LSERIKSLEAAKTPSSAQAEVERDNQKMQQLQADLRSLLDQAAKNEASLAAMRERLEKAESDRVPLSMVYALIALLLFCIAALAYFVTKRPGFGRQVGMSKAAKPPGTAASTTAPLALEDEVPPTQAGDIDVNLLDLDDESFTEMMGNQAHAEAVAKTRHHNFNADALVDIRQQAEFLAKLGKIDEALEILEAGIRANPVESPLLFLDLLVIANNFSRKTDFRQFSAEFAQLFNGKVPEFALFRDEGRKLDAYPALLDHIHGQWDSPQVLDVIEACILRDADATESDPFDLAAFRELIQMHAAAIEHHRA
jgi:tetratricopeptide (TPR) repeat protein